MDTHGIVWCLIGHPIKKVALNVKLELDIEKNN